VRLCDSALSLKIDLVLSALISDFASYVMLNACLAAMFCLFVCLAWELGRVVLWFWRQSPSCPGTHYVAWAGFEIMILLPQPPKC
jgi:hypothetical protein